MSKSKNREEPKKSRNGPETKASIHKQFACKKRDESEWFACVLLPQARFHLAFDRICAHHSFGKSNRWNSGQSERIGELDVFDTAIYRKAYPYKFCSTRRHQTEISISVCRFPLWSIASRVDTLPGDANAAYAWCGRNACTCVHISRRMFQSKRDRYWGEELPCCMDRECNESCWDFLRRMRRWLCQTACRRFRSSWEESEQVSRTCNISVGKCVQSYISYCERTHRYVQEEWQNRNENKNWLKMHHARVDVNGNEIRVKKSLNHFLDVYKYITWEWEDYVILCTDCLIFYVILLPYFWC